MNTKTIPKRVYKIGDTQYILPFRSEGFYVSDAKGYTVLEAQSYKAADAMAKMLNEQAQK